jgi:rRNA maturation endonuclease Nob1
VWKRMNKFNGYCNGCGAMVYKDHYCSHCGAEFDLENSDG